MAMLATAENMFRTIGWYVSRLPQERAKISPKNLFCRPLYKVIAKRLNLVEASNAGNSRVTAARDRNHLNSHFGGKKRRS